MNARAPIQFDSILPDPGLVRRLVENNGPYLPVQRYFNSAAEYRSSSARGPMLIAPNFRGDWAYDQPLIEDVEPILHHAGLRDAAAEMFGSHHVRPYIVYANLTWQLPFDQGQGHTDVPAFRGVERTTTPIWLLSLMGRTGLFEQERVNIATAVAWFYEGADGGFCYWPDGPDRAPSVHEGEIFNTAILGDNDRMFHRVRPVGERSDGLLTGLTLDSRLERAGEKDWRIVEAGKELASFPYEKLRISVSWKAQVFRDAEEERLYDQHLADIDLDDVWKRIDADLKRRGSELSIPADPVRDPRFIDALSAIYNVEPSVFD